jgi:hypothetical protein
MSVALPTGFKFMPVTAWCTIGVIAVPLLVSVLDGKPYFMFAWDPFITKWNQYWRLFILQLQFQNQSEVALGTVLLSLKLKGVERIFGSLKLFKIIILLFLYNLVMITIISFTLFHSIGWDLFIPSGPFGVLFGLYYPYNKYIPETYVAEFDFSNLANFQPLGETISLTITDKFSCQILYLLLFFNEGISSIFPSLIGYFIGFLYFNELVPFTDSSLGYLDPLYYKLTHEKEYEIENQIESRLEDTEDPSNNLTNVPDNESHAIDLSANENNSREDTPVQNLGQQFLNAFRR